MSIKGLFCSTVIKGNEEKERSQANAYFASQHHPSYSGKIVTQEQKKNKQNDGDIVKGYH